MTRIGTIATVALAILTAPIASARPASQNGPPEGILYYETVVMSGAATQAAGRGGTRELSFHTLGRRFDLTLEPHSPFAQGATVHWVDETGEVVEPPETGMHYRGRIQGDPDSWARITIHGTALGGVMASGDEMYFLAPAKRFFGDADAEGTLAYRLSDMDTESIAGSCAARAPSERLRHRHARAKAARRALRQLLGQTATTAGAGTLKQLDLGMVGDFEYFSAHGGSSAADIAEIINSVDGIYQAEIGVTVQLLTTVIFTSSQDPFSSSTVPGTLLSEFGNWKAANDNNPSQSMYGTDLAHIITGRNLDGNVIGIAYLDVLCASGSGVGVNQDFSSDVNMLTLLVAHEMGHNFAAPHDNQSGPCSGTPGTFIMNPVLSGSLLHQFSPCSEGFMNAAVASAGCMSDAGPPAPLTLSPLSAPITVGGPLTLTGTGFTAGSVINIFVASPTGVTANGPYWPSNRTSTTLTFNQINPSIKLGRGFGTIVVINTDQGFIQSNTQSQYVFGNPSLNIPTITGINGVGLRPFSKTVPLASVETAVAQGTTVSISGTGFNGSMVNLFTATGPIGPLTPNPDSTSTTLWVTIPPGAPTGPGSFQVVNSPYQGNVTSNAVSVALGAQLTVTGVSQTGTTIHVYGSGFSPVSVINFFNSQPNGAVINLGGYGPTGGPRIPLTLLSDSEFIFSIPSGAASGNSYVHILNPPYIPFSSTGGDPDGSFILSIP